MALTVKWEDVEKTLTPLTTEEQSAIDLKVKLVGEIIKAREAQGVTQAELGEKAGLKQSAIARLESNKIDTTLSTILKVLSPLGLTLDIVPKKATL